MNEYTLRRLHRFAVRYKNLYEMCNNEIPAMYDAFAAHLAEAGFSKDSETEALTRYLKNDTHDKDEFEQILFETDDLSQLGNAVYARWSDIINDETQSLLSENNRAWMIHALGRVAELSEPEHTDAFDFDAKLESIKLISVKPFSSMNDQNDTRQNLSLNSKGKLNVSFYGYDQIAHKEKLKKKQSTQLNDSQTEMIMHEIRMCFAKESFDMISLYDPYYEIEMSTHDRRTYKVRGLLNNDDADRKELSDMIRECSGMNSLYVFDGHEGN